VVRFLVFLILIWIGVVNSDNYWELLNEGAAGSVTSVDFVNSHLGFAGGERGIFLKTTDQGENWEKILLNENLHINQIDFVNENHGWAVCWESDSGKGQILYTSDGGQNWAVQSESEYSLYSIFAVNLDTVFAAGDKSILFKTDDGGSNTVAQDPD